MIGKTILHYKILSKLGEGGMGVVYRALDTELEREVAIKFLPGRITADSEERERFRIEAKAAAALNHANIATIHAIEKTDEEIFIVMEYIQGKELKALVKQNPNGLSIDEIIDYGGQIAEGLSAAHEADIVHRDIKSANIIVTDKGKIKIMDFGLAKVRGGAQVTQAGTTLGTAAYMSPEQARGEASGRRGDIWSLGVVLYEMLTGQLPFGGDYDQAVIYGILNEEPKPIAELRGGSDPGLQHVVDRALAKKPDDRYGSAEALLRDLQAIRGDTASQRPAAAAPSPAATGSSNRKVLVAGAIVIVLLIALVAYLKFGSGPSIPNLVNPRQLTSAIGVENNPTWSPDGDRLAYHTERPGTDIWVLQIGGGQPVNLTRDHDGFDAFPDWSPDGTQIAFLSAREGAGFFAMPAVGGTPRPLGIEAGFAQLVWAKGGSAVITTKRGSRALAQITSLDQGETQDVPLAGKYSFKFDFSVSPDDRFLAYVDGNGTNAEVTRIWTVRLSDSLAFPVTEGRFNARSPTWSRDGMVLYFVSNRGGSADLWQMAINKEGQPEGTPLPITAGVGMLMAEFSPDGRQLAYSRGRWVANIWRTRIPKPGEAPASWADAEQVTFDNALIEFMDISPDGSHLAFSSDRSGNQDIWTVPIAGGEPRQITTDPTPDWNPMWSPDGRKIAFYAFRSGNRDIWVMPASGGTASQLTRHENVDYRPTWSPDGDKIAFISERTGIRHLWVVDATGGDPVQLTSGTDSDYDPVWSPDGKSVGFYSSRIRDYILGIWIAPAGGGEPRQLLSSKVNSDGRYFCWSQDGTEVYIKTGRDILGQGEYSLSAVSISDGSVRRLAHLKGRYGTIGVGNIATNGEYLYFTWSEPTGDIWVMDVEER